MFPSMKISPTNARQRLARKALEMTTALSIAAVASLCGATVGIAPAFASDLDGYATGTQTDDGQYVRIGLSKSVVIRLPAEAKDVIVGDPGVVDAVVRNRNTAYLFARAVGQTNIFFFDAAGNQIAGFDIAVKRDLNGIREAIRQVVPDSDIRVEPLGADGVVLTGIAATPADAQTAFAVAGRLLNAGTNGMVNAGDKVVNAITVKGRDQINLRVTVAEVQRDVIKQLGVNLNGTVGVGSAVLRFNNENPFPVHGSALVPENYLLGDKKLYMAAFQATRAAYSQTGLIDAGGMKSALDMLARFTPELKDAKIDLTATFDDRFARKAAQTVK